MTSAPPAARRALLGALIFGLSDGLMSNLGVVLNLRAHPGLVLWTAAISAVSGGCSMGVGQHLSEDNDDSVARCVMLGAATLVGSILPASPFAVLHGTAAIGSTGGVSAALIVAVAHVRGRGEVRRWLTVAGLLAAVFVVTLGCALAVPGGGAG